MTQGSLIPYFNGSRPASMIDFDGATYDPALDRDRLLKQMGRVYQFMLDGCWHTLAEIHAYAGGSETACSSRVRDLRKPKFGSHDVWTDRRAGGVWVYRLAIENEGKTVEAVEP